MDPRVVVSEAAGKVCHLLHARRASGKRFSSSQFGRGLSMRAVPSTHDAWSDKPGAPPFEGCGRMRWSIRFRSAFDYLRKDSFHARL